MKLPPDIISTGVSTNYIFNSTTSTGHLSANASIGFGQWSISGAPGLAYVVTDDLTGGFVLEADMDSAGNLLGGTVTISGILTDSSYNELSTEGQVIKGNLTNFGYVSNVGGTPSLEFTFDSLSGGSLDIGPKGGLILTVNNSTPNPISFAADFYDSGISTVDTFALHPSAVPTPSAAWAGVVLLGGLGLRKVRRQ